MFNVPAEVVPVYIREAMLGAPIVSSLGVIEPEAVPEAKV
jgi:hypothetical protein